MIFLLRQTFFISLFFSMLFIQLHAKKNDLVKETVELYESNDNYYEIWPIDYSPLIYVNCNGDGYIYTNGHKYKFYNIHHCDDCNCQEK